MYVVHSLCFLYSVFAQIEEESVFSFSFKVSRQRLNRGGISLVKFGID